MKKFWYALLVVLGRPGIVVFQDGMFGVRKGIIFRQYLDMHESRDNKGKIHWWSTWEYVLQYSKGSLETAAIAHAQLFVSKPKKDRGKLAALMW